MNEHNAALSAVIDEYCAELNAADTSAFSDYAFSGKYKQRKQKAVRLSSGRPRFSLKKSTLILIAVAVLLAGCGVAYAYEPIRSFVVELSGGTKTITPDPDTIEKKSYREQMIDEYIIDVPEGFVLDREDYAHGNTHFGRTYRNEADEVIYFDQYRNDVFETYYPANTELVSITDKHGRELLVSYTAENYIQLYWNTGEYTLRLSGSFTEEELMEIYYTARLKK